MTDLDKAPKVGYVSALMQMTICQGGSIHKVAIWVTECLKHLYDHSSIQCKGDACVGMCTAADCCRILGAQMRKICSFSWHFSVVIQLDLS